MSNSARRKIIEMHAEIGRLKRALSTARDALTLPCDRWNKTQSEIVSKAISEIDAILIKEEGL